MDTICNPENESRSDAQGIILHLPQESSDILCYLDYGLRVTGWHSHLSGFLNDGAPPFCSVINHKTTRFKFRRNNRKIWCKARRKYRKFKVEYPDIIGFLDVKYGEPILIDHLQNLDNWDVTGQQNWGSAMEGNYCTYVEQNVVLNEVKGDHFVDILTTADSAVGLDWGGYEVSKPISSGMIRSRFTVTPGQVVSATIDNSQSYEGSWFAFWLFKKTVPEDERYREIDIFEKFQNRKRHNSYTISVHGGFITDRNMMNFKYRLRKVDEKNMTFTCELCEDGVQIFLNGIHIFTSQRMDLNGEYYIIFNDAPTDHSGKVNVDKIREVLPRIFRIKDVRVHSLE